MPQISERFEWAVGAGVAGERCGGERRSWVTLVPGAMGDATALASTRPSPTSRGSHAHMSRRCGALGFGAFRSSSGCGCGGDGGGRVLATVARGAALGAPARASGRSAFLGFGRGHHGAARDGLGAPFRELIDGARGEEQPSQRLLLFLLFGGRRFGRCGLGHDNGCGPCVEWSVPPRWRDRQGRSSSEACPWSSRSYLRIERGVASVRTGLMRRWRSHALAPLHTSAPERSWFS